MYLRDFSYAAPQELSEVIDLLNDEGRDSKIIAGGQSLIPLMKLKLAAPSLVVDLRKVRELQEPTRLDNGCVVISAMASYSEVLADPLVAEHAPLLSAAVCTVADRQVRRLGTLGGSCAHADPAGDAPAALTALGATFVIQGRDGRREVAAVDFFRGFMETSLDATDVLVEIRVPSMAGWRVSYQKMQGNAQAWATAAVGVAIKIENRYVTGARVGLCNLGMTPLLAEEAQNLLTGRAIDYDIIRSAARKVAASVSPSSDVFASAEYRSHLAEVLTVRAIESAIDSKTCQKI